MTNAIETDLIKSMRKTKEPHRQSNIVYRITYEGDFLVMMSGKTVWKRIGDAKNALRNHVETFCINKGYNYAFANGVYNQLLPKVTFEVLRVF